MITNARLCSHQTLNESSLEIGGLESRMEALVTR